jgi:ActD protein
MAGKRKVRPATYGLMAEFDNPSDAVAAARRVHEEGYTKIDAFSPYPVEELSEAIGVHKTYMPHVVLTGGILGGLAGYLMQYYLHVIYYPINVGGKPMHSWPAFIPITFEMTVLGAGLFAVFGMLAMNGLPEPYHPVFNAPNFALASRDRFFVLIESTDPKFDRERTAEFLRTLNAREVTDVEH